MRKMKPPRIERIERIDTPEFRELLDHHGVTSARRCLPGYSVTEPTKSSRLNYDNLAREHFGTTNLLAPLIMENKMIESNAQNAARTHKTQEVYAFYALRW